VVRQTLKRVGGLKHDDKVGYHTFLHRPEGDRPGGLERALLPRKEEYPAYVASVLARHGLGHRRTVFWVYPRNFEFPALAQLFEPDLVVADVMDDHRTWVEAGSRYHEQLTRNYRDILGGSDVVLANCAGVRDAMAEFREDIHVLPNACELPAGAPGGVPRELRRLRGPVVGYVGNLSSRIDIPLLDHMARARPEWNIVLVGSAHLNRDVLALDEHANVHFLGVRPYEEVKRLVAGFDVAIIPHVDNEMTQTMNPLKAFVYCAHNVPVVSSPVANLDEMSELIDTASGPEDFVAKVDAAIARGRPAEPSPRRREILAANSWERRVEDVLRLLDAAG
jgi:Glycosyl transferases group 1